ncbi:TonB-dependent receptor [Colwelliaceae bacterium 6441]
MKFNKSSIALAFSIPALYMPTVVLAENTARVTQEKSDSEIEHVVITSSFNKQTLAEAPSSITVIDENQINDQAMQHFEELLNGVANLNFSGGTSRPKYLQIRGVGERSEYRGAPNASVGFVIDDIDLSGLGMAANMFDVEQVEVLRGPQGTRFGATALAGLIYIKSNDPTETSEHGLRSSFGDDNLVTLAGFSSGAISENLSYRVSLEQHQQDGYRKNTYLDRNDTNNIDELTGKFKLRYLASEQLTVDFTYLYANLDNGFDAWTLDNNGFESITDAPGVDNQKSHGSALKFSYQGLTFADFTAITSYTSTDHQHAFDGDWANGDYWANKTCTDYYDENNNGAFDDEIPCVYDYLWDKKAQRDVVSQEFRFNSNNKSKIFNRSTDWIVGFYLSELEENNDLNSSYNGWPDEVVDSQYNANNYAIFTQLDSALPDDYQLSTGLRFERRTTDYNDSLGDTFSPSENMWGGHIALSKEINKYQSVYARVARGYKAGGFNMGLPEQLSLFKKFDKETLVNYEVGVKSSLLNNALVSQIAIFHMVRQDQQVNTSVQNPEKPQQFTIYTANATSSTSHGVEADLSWTVNNALLIYSTVGYLNATYDEYSYFDKYGTKVDISGRKLAHAPDFTYSLGATYRGNSGFFSNINMSGKTSFYFSDSHDEKSSSADLLNAKVGYESSTWSVYLWGRNLTDEKVATRGFYFGNEPDLDWVNKKYQRYGAPRQIGLTLDYQF